MSSIDRDSFVKIEIVPYPLTVPKPPHEIIEKFNTKVQTLMQSSFGLDKVTVQTAFFTKHNPNQHDYCDCGCHEHEK